MEYNGYSPETSLDDIEKDHIHKVMVHFDGSKTRAAEVLGMSLKCLYYKLDNLGLLEKYRKLKGRPRKIKGATSASLPVAPEGIEIISDYSVPNTEPIS